MGVGFVFAVLDDDFLSDFVEHCGRVFVRGNAEVVDLFLKMQGLIIDFLEKLEIPCFNFPKPFTPRVYLVINPRHCVLKHLKLLNRLFCPMYAAVDYCGLLLVMSDCPPQFED